MAVTTMTATSYGLLYTLGYTNYFTYLVLFNLHYNQWRMHYNYPYISNEEMVAKEVIHNLAKYEDPTSWLYMDALNPQPDSSCAFRNWISHCKCVGISWEHGREQIAGYGDGGDECLGQEEVA